MTQTPTQDGIVLLTQRGREKTRDALITNTSVAITQVALGDGNGAKYDPTNDQTALVSETMRRPIDTQYRLGDDGVMVRVTFPETAPHTVVRELGFFDEDDELIYIWAGTTREDTYTGGSRYTQEFMLTFDGVNGGLIIVDAPNDDVMAFMVASLANQASMARDIFQLQQSQKEVA